MNHTTDAESVTRRTALKTIGVGTIGIGALGGTATARPACELDACTEAFLLDPPTFPGAPVQWDGETVARNRKLVKVGASVEAVDPAVGTIEVPFGFDPLVTCVREGTTVEFRWLNQTAVNPDFPDTVHHNVEIFQFTPDCEYATGSLVSSGEPVGFHPPDESEPVSFEHTFEEAGVYPYYCEPHGYPAVLPGDLIDDAHGLPPNFLGMRGAVIVR